MDLLNIEMDLKENTHICCIHFASQNRPVGSFDRYPVPDGVSNIYINSGDRSWYLKGLVSLGDSLADSINYFKSLITRMNYSRVICIGSSMGAFGAALFATRLDAECICFAPELHINIFGGFSADDNLADNLTFNFQQPRRALLVAGLVCPSDALSTLYYREIWQNTDAMILKDCGHEVVPYLKCNGRLASMIDSFIADKRFNNCDTASIEKLRGVIQIVSPAEISCKHVEHFYEATKGLFTSYCKLRLAEHLTNRKVYDVAHRILSEYLEEHGPLSEAVFLQAKVLRRMRKDNAALSAFKSLELNPEYRLQGLWGQSMIHAKLGNEAEAQRLYQIIIKGASEAPIVKTSLKLYNEIKERGIIHAPYKTLLLTTFPAHKSRNVGDSMIASSAKALLKSRASNIDVFTLFREEKLDNYKTGSIKSIVAPGFSVSNDVYPSLYRLFSDLDRLPEFYPVGCSFQHPIASQKSFDTYEYNRETIDFLQFIVKRSGPLPCRDQLIVDMLQRYDIPALYSGDLVLFDKNYLNTLFTPPETVESVVFTIQHHAKYREQSFKVLEVIRDQFPEAKKYVSFHSKVGPYPREIADFAVGMGFDELHLYGDASNLDIYDNIDLHIGYRLHGHISFLRRRKPSVLLVEDARSFGFARTQGTSIGCFDALDERTERPSLSVHRIIAEYVDYQLKNGFSGYRGVFGFIDKTYEGVISPLFDKLAAKIENHRP
jgi:hypothetical protein